MSFSLKLFNEVLAICVSLAFRVKFRSFMERKMLSLSFDGVCHLQEGKKTSPAVQCLPDC